MRGHLNVKLLEVIWTCIASNGTVISNNADGSGCGIFCTGNNFYKKCFTTITTFKILNFMYILMFSIMGSHKI